MEKLREFPLWFIFPAMLLVLIALPVFAGSQETHKAELSGDEEVPAVSSTGSGILLLKVDDSSIDYILSYADLEGTTTAAAHIHLGQFSVNGGVSVFLCSGSRPPCTPGDGTFSGTIMPTDVIGPAGQGIASGEFDELLRAIRAGLTYVNVHTDKHPGGEIRGQISQGGNQNE